MSEGTKAIRRSIEEITASARMNMTDMIHRAIALGMDLTEAKEQLEHGKFLPWLKALGLSSSTANNYMRVAREIQPGSRLADLPYSKALALLGAPADEREALADQAADKSAAEIRKLIEERNRALEAANAESARADMAEKEAKDFHDQIGSLNVKIQNLELKAERAHKEAGEATADLLRKADALRNELNKQTQYAADLRRELEEKQAALLTAENNVVEVEKTVEVAPADYEEVKKQLEISRRSVQELIDAASEAEARASAAETEAERLRTGGAPAEKPLIIRLGEAANAFFREAELMPFQRDAFHHDTRSIGHIVEQMENWCARMRTALEADDVDGEGAVMVE